MVRGLQLVAGGLLFICAVTGTISDSPRENPPLTLGSYHVLATDFHVHSFPLSWGVLSPWDTVLESRREGLDAIAMTPHNHTWVAKLAQRLFPADNPIVLVGEEIHARGYHVLAIGIQKTIDWRQPANTALDEVHRQGGVAIAAHPIDAYAAYDDNAIQKLDGAEVVHPLGMRDEVLADQLRRFFSRAPLTAIGDTDYHLGPLSPYVGEMGLGRTYVFATERTARGILDAVRDGRTVVYDRDKTFGDPALIELAAEDGRLPKLASNRRERSAAVLMGGVSGVFGLVALILAANNGWRWR